MNFSNLTLGDWSAIMVIAGSLMTAIWVVWKPIAIKYHRHIGDIAYKEEFSKVRETHDKVSQIIEDHLPRVESIAQTSLDTAERSEKKIDGLNDTLSRIALGRLDQLGR